MTRTSVTLRCAEPGDAPVLAELWTEALRRVDHQEQTSDLEIVIKESSTSAEQRVVVADYDGALAGAVLLKVSTVSPLNLEPVVHVISPHVFPQFRRHGIGRQLMEAAVTFAEEVGVEHIGTAAIAGSRDANRFMARLGLGPHAMMRLAPTIAVRAKLTAQRPALPTTSDRRLTRVIAHRRSLRRAQASESAPTAP